MTTTQPPKDSPFSEHYGRQLTDDELAELRFNLVNFIETLIQMDRQHQDWLQRNKQEEGGKPDQQIEDK